VKPPKEPERYKALLDALLSADTYSPVRVLDSHMGITLKTSTPSNVRRSFYENMSFHFPVKLYLYAQGGPYPSTAYVWRVSEPLVLARDAAAYARAVSKAPTVASRAMIQEFFERFTAIGAHKAALRDIYRFLAPHSIGDRNEAQRQLDERFVCYLLQNDEAHPQLFFDMRWLNGPDGDKFMAFWDELGVYLRLEVGESAHERRHAVDAISYASKIVSIPSLIREVSKLLHEKPDHERDPIPGPDCVRLQFSPNHPQRLTAGRFSARYKIIRKVRCAARLIP
jgi:hypothetical protein